MHVQLGHVRRYGFSPQNLRQKAEAICAEFFVQNEGFDLKISSPLRSQIAQTLKLHASDESKVKIANVFDALLVACTEEVALVVITK